MQRYASRQTRADIVATIALSYALLFVLLIALEQERAVQLVAGSFFVAAAWGLGRHALRARFRKPKYAIVPFGRALGLDGGKGVSKTLLTMPDLTGRRYDGVVADLHAPDLPPVWERFLAHCTMARIPVYHYKQVDESLTGRVKIDHLAENEFGALLPSPGYEVVKRLIDVSVVLITSPVWLPVMLVTGLIVKLESDGPMFFIQDRVGQGNRNFRVYKLRSMCADSEKNGAQFAQANDMRITGFGRFIRKTRLDELPQFLNVLRGDMSLIGPRPEQRFFVNQFEEHIPFYTYRHVVKPGITGWAQVVHGYAADAEDTQIKIEHDFYYIKHFSIWLDVLIVYKTIRTVLTGFGAR
ncbi:exopolysaccharide biosynthesis polyprenyl glycosylphosphotransferase [Pseudomonas sp. OIL-1]|nr:exopolysaccharide biosynthesis polyprenyl glycosylphosphotransferase [Pseudomonas sp. OIL-1]